MYPDEIVRPMREELTRVGFREMKTAEEVDAVLAPLVSLDAVGIVLFELLAGLRPFDAPTIAGVIYNIVHEEPPILDAPSLGLPAGISAIVERAGGGSVMKRP